MPKTILVIDDDEAVRDAFSLALQDSGYTVTAAVSGEEGVLMAQQTSPDLVFLDLRMPGINGVETLRQLQDYIKSAQVYIVTAFHRDFMSELGEAKKDGLVFQVAQKPLAGKHIRAIVQGVLDGPQAINN